MCFHRFLLSQFTLNLKSIYIFKKVYYIIRCNMIKKNLLLLLFIFIGTLAYSANVYGELTLKTSDASKGLVYVEYFRYGLPVPNAPEISQYATSSKHLYKGNEYYGDICWAGWAKPTRGNVFVGWETQLVDSIKPAQNSEAYVFYANTLDLSYSSGSPTKLTGTAKWENATEYSITYLTPKYGTYSVNYSYLQVADGALYNGSESYNFTSATAAKAVKSYEEDVVTLSTTLSSFLGWYEVDDNGNETLLSLEPTYIYKVTGNTKLTAHFEQGQSNKASVIDGGNTTEYETLAEAVEAANALSSTPTIKLLDNNLDITEAITFTKSMILDLNGLTLSGSASNMLTISNGAVVTITDESADGKGILSVSAEDNSRLVGINIANGKLNFEKGTIHVENTSTSQSSSSTAVMVSGNSEFVQTDGIIEVLSAANAYAVHVSANAKADINKADITAITTGGSTAYGVFAEGNTTIGDAIITAASSTTNAVGVYSTGTTVINNAIVTALPGTTNGYAVSAVQGTCTLNGGKFSAKFPSAKVDVNQTDGKLIVNGGYYVFLKDLQGYVSEDYTVYDVDANDAAYSEGFRFFVDSFDAGIDVAKINDTSYPTLKEALSAANSGDTVILTNNCRLSDNVTVPQGVTLLIPCDSEYTPIVENVYTTKVFSEICAFKTLTMMPGSSIDVEGKLSVASYHYTTNTQLSLTNGGPSSVTGNYGCIDMSRGGNITLHSGSALYAWGYIVGQDKDQGDNTSGAGTITALDGSSVYEGFVVGDWRGGGKTACLGSDPTYKVFPFSQYFISNIEVPLTIKHGATEYAVFTVSGGSGSAEMVLAIDLISSSDASLFKISDASSQICKHYDATSDRQIISLDGNTVLNAINIDAGSTLQVESSAFVLPITSNMTINVNSGCMDILHDVEFIPGSEMNISKDASVNINGSAYVYDVNNWNYYLGGNKYYYTTLEGRPTAHNSLTTWTSKDGLNSAKVLVDGTLNVKGNLCTTLDGADIVSSDEGIIVFEAAPQDAVTYQILGSGDTKTEYKVNEFVYNDVTYWVYCTPVSTASALLRNADGTTTKTAGSEAGTTFYYSPYTNMWDTSLPVPSAIDNNNVDIRVSNTYYSVNGIRQNGIKKGINIIKMSDGTAKKVAY